HIAREEARDDVLARHLPGAVVAARATAVFRRAQRNVTGRRALRERLPPRRERWLDLSCALTVAVSNVEDASIIGSDTSSSDTAHVTSLKETLTTTAADGLSDGTRWTVATGASHGGASINASTGLSVLSKATTSISTV
ncbi:MAG: hypothetical protein ACO3JL_14865, partial [Myxococcota bacterium]